MSGKNNDSYILVADDNLKNLQVLGVMLREEGYQVGIVEDGEQAFDAALEDLPDLVLMDVMMPVMDGFEACERFKQHALLRDIPIIFLTAKTDAETIVKGLELGAVDYVTKPFNPKELLTRVQTHLELKMSKDLLRKISQERMELVHILCHDLANPVGISHSLVTGLDASNVEEYKLHLDRTLRNGLNVIDLVRQMQSLEENELPLEEIYLWESIRGAVTMMREKITKKNIEVVFKGEGEQTIEAEQTSLINSVLNNILTNAVKFSYPDSKIFVNAEEADGRVLVSIKDEGIGMSESILENIFKIGKRSSRRGTQGEIGTGFGMPLVKKFMQAYGGSVEVRSKDGNSDPNNRGTEILLDFKAY